MKGLKIFNIILFSLICAVQVVIIGIYINFLLGLTSNSFAGVFEVLFSTVYYIIGLGILLVLAIILTITTKKKINKMEIEGLTKTKFDKLCVLLPWLFFVLDFILFISFFVISKLK